MCLNGFLNVKFVVIFYWCLLIDYYCWFFFCGYVREGKEKKSSLVGRKMEMKERDGGYNLNV